MMSILDPRRLEYLPGSVQYNRKRTGILPRVLVVVESQEVLYCSNESRASLEEAGRAVREGYLHVRRPDQPNLTICEDPNFL